MDSFIVKHLYFNKDNIDFSEISFDIFKTYSNLLDYILDFYIKYTKEHEIEFNEENILVYRIGTINSLGEFKILSNPMPIYLKEVKEWLNND